ncbi:MAG TPA: type II toxin-antitoxin system VapC family toxin [Phycisphaerae bacterium]|nr:type II toxin-antitoxin system VapC family toxin [Phycisphaerae bacterium]HOJ73432.1 type II toxin-antitoxin system VapC family toxin [Phycisphaerae bacterium]HOM51041.1 type II toxin-antitoxin system VapC family toxin [Phycisphaerae bacterium]HON66310.1 type II toxin-antitoxin system VapC family toxin [Phycisphaerae bacterium]HOQ85184.1 type II toxin-antitoxin system VapC family toxin [Phycisphaerae bacterium]
MQAPGHTVASGPCRGLSHRSGEILHGIERLPQGRRRSKLEQAANVLFGQLECQSVPESAGDRYAKVKLACQTRELSLDENDLWIASIALILGARLVTRDSDFPRIEGLQVGDWSAWEDVR